MMQLDNASHSTAPLPGPSSAASCLAKRCSPCCKPISWNKAPREQRYRSAMTNWRTCKRPSCCTKPLTMRCTTALNCSSIMRRPGASDCCRAWATQSQQPCQTIRQLRVPPPRRDGHGNGSNPVKALLTGTFFPTMPPTIRHFLNMIRAIALTLQPLVAISIKLSHQGDSH